MWKSAGWRRLAALGVLLGVLEAPVVIWAPVSLASTVNTAAFSGGANTATAGGVVYAKSGGVLTLNVTTSSDTQCIDVSGSFTAHQQSSTAKSNWSFGFTAGSGDGPRSVSIVARPGFNGQGNCTGASGSGSASFMLDNSAPTLLPSDTNKTGADFGVSPAPNAAGWNNSNVSIAWKASDAGSGIATGPTPATDTVTANTNGTVKSATATDRLGFTGNGSVTIKLDKVSPNITAAAPSTTPWYNQDVPVAFACQDPSPSEGPGKESGIKSCTPPQVVSTNGGTATGTAVDNADNSKSVTAGPFKIDKVAPSISGSPAGSPNGAGWYGSNVTVHWTCSDTGGSGLAGSCPADDTISGEGQGLTATETVTDVAGNSTTATSSPAVNIDKTAPSTDATAPDGWNNQSVTVSLVGKDALSGVDATYFKTDGGAQETYSATHQPTFSSDGVHALEYWSVDKAGNAETHKTVQVKIDGTSPTITHALVPPANANGWNAGDVTVDFSCDDDLSGIASCGPDAVVSTEGKDQIVTGRAQDNAGNTASDPASVSVDKTKPAISAAADRAPNAAGWYADDVVVSFTCGDALSGIDTCPAAKTLGEGADQSASGTATDAAGNSASDGVSGIDVDETRPSLAGAPTTAANANGWYRDDVTIDWTCSDGLSGIDGACPPNSVITGEGAALSASASVSDKAGNERTATVNGIKIDRYAPATAAGVPAPLESGWYAGPVQVTLSAVDKLSGVDATKFTIDGGSAQDYSGPFSVGGGGRHTVVFWSTDKAGNVEDKTAPENTIELRVDNLPPSINGDRTPAANANGWNNGPVAVTFTCDDAESGIAGCSEPTTLGNEGAGQSVTGNAADNAGNTAEATVKDINIDLTAPNLAGQLPDPTGMDPNGASWYTGNVAVTWVCSDGLSLIDGACPASSTITGEGRNLGAGPVSVSDRAGNSTSNSVGNVNIDRKGPAIAGGPTTQPNGDGWYSGLVKVGFDCSDPKLGDGSAGSGVASCPSDMNITDEGANLGVTSAAAKDYAGNSTPGRTVGGINIDNTPPVSGDTVSCTLVGAYCNGSSPVSMTINASDPTPAGVSGVSGVKEIHYTKDGGATWTTANGNSVSVPITLSSSGTATVSYYAVDRAGNAEDKHADSVNYDGTSPDVSHTLTPAANAADWSNANTLVHFGAKDDPGGSGVNTASITSDQTYSSETADQVITGTADDNAGNRGTDSFHFHLDKTAPTISATVAPGSPDGQNGWYVHPVQVSFACGDPAAANGAAGSGVAVCPDPVTLSQNGAGQSVTRSVADKADNTASRTAGGISIDMEKPTLTIGGVKDDAIYTLGSVPAPTCSANDSFSGVASCTGSKSGGQPNGVGTFTYTATATDKAGNSVTQSVTYKVVYNVPANAAFFLQPINDTAHTASSTLSIFKAGQTVPVKFQLKNAAGQVVQANSVPLWQTPAQGNLTSSSVNESSFGTTGDSGSGFRWDSSAQQYIYNWNTAATQGGSYWKIGVKLDDGQTYYTDIGLRK